MTRKMYTVFLPIFLAVLVFVSLFSVWLEEPYTFHRANVGAGVLNADYFLPTPDSVVYKGTFTHRFSGEEQQKLLEAFDLAFSSWMRFDHFKRTVTTEEMRTLMKESGALEFRYSAKQTCSAAPWGKTQEYDAIWVFLEYEKPYFIRVRNGSPKGYPLFLCGMDEPTAAEYRAILKEVFSHHHYRTPDWIDES